MHPYIKNAFGISVIAMMLSVALYLVVYIPRKDALLRNEARERQTAMQQTELSNQQKSKEREEVKKRLDECISGKLSFMDMYNGLDAPCAEGTVCEEIKYTDKIIQDGIKECYKKFPLK